MDEPSEDVEFWAVNIAPGTSHEETLEMGQTLTVRHAALQAKSGDSASLSIFINDEEFTLCTLSKQNPQFSLKLVFSDFESPLKFSNSGPAKISLIGYQSTTDFGDNFGGEDDFDEEMLKNADLELSDEEVTSDEEVKVAPKVPQQAQQNKAQQKPQQNGQQKPAQNGQQKPAQNGQKKEDQKQVKKPETPQAAPQKEGEKKKNKNKKNKGNSGQTTPQGNKTPQGNTPAKRPNEASNTPSSNKKPKTN